MGHKIAATLFIFFTLNLTLFSFQTAPAPTEAAATSPFLYGADAVLNPDNLPQLGAYSQTYMVSSYDRAGGNLDAGYSMYQERADRYIIFDTVGAGVVYRIWMTGSPLAKSGRLQFFLDDEPNPRLDVDLETFFSGKYAPFLAPVTGGAEVSSGGYYSYLPIVYAKRLRITTTGAPQYYQISYQKLAGSQNIASFTGKENYNRLYDMFRSVSTDPKPTLPNRQIYRGVDTLSPGGTISLGKIKGPGVISSIKLKLNLNQTSELLSSTFIKIKWDGRDIAQVDAPLDYFFGSGFGEKRVAGLMAGIDRQSHEYYFYFPMPFRVDASISLANTNSKVVGQVSWEIGFDPDAGGSLVNDNTGYFNATFRKEKEPPEGKDYVVLRANGRGRYVGTMMNFYGSNSSTESDERVFLDGSSTPQLHGTGYEDYFNGGFGFKFGAFSQALHGSADLLLPAPPFKFINMGGYRFHLGDAISFNTGIVVSVEHGRLGKNETVPNEEFRSLALWYGLDDQPSLEPSDSLDVGNVNSEITHNYVKRGVQAEGSLKSSYEGENDDKILEDNGYYLREGSEFNLNINPNNNGVILRRRMDFNDINQQANIYIDGQFVAKWYSPGLNQAKRWRDEDFVIPPGFSKGKASVRVRVEVLVDPSPWSEFYYAAYSINPRFGFVPESGMVSPTPAPTATPTPIPPTVTPVAIPTVIPTIGATPVPPTATPNPPLPVPNILNPDPAFRLVWARTDDPVSKGAVTRSWTWGSTPNGLRTLTEEYNGKPRLVQYHDKARMEINNPNANRNDPYFVTNGLLVKELISGQVQTGDFTFVRRSSAQIPLVGDPNDNGKNAIAPTYASFQAIASLDSTRRMPNRFGQVVNAAIAKDGTVSTAIPALVQIAYYDDTLGHNIPDVFWNFINSTGLVLEGNIYKTDNVINWVYALGYPLSEPYWTRAVVGGTPKDVLVQVFERRVLSYTPTNPPGFQVEMGNVGQHYYQWRYN